MPNKAICIEISNALLIEPGILSAAQQAHCQQCQPCETELESSVKLVTSFQVYIEKTQSQAQDIDVCGTLMAQISAPEDVRRTWSFALGAVMAIVALCVFVWSYSRSDDGVFSVATISTDAALLRSAEGLRPIAGKNVPFALPLLIETQQAQHVTISLGQSVLVLKEHTQVMLYDRHILELERGAVLIQNEQTIRVSLANSASVQFSVFGHVELEAKGKQSTMKLLKRHKIAAASAIAVIAVYSGWTVMKNGSGDEVKVSAGKGAYIDAKGKAHTFDLEQSLSSAQVSLATSASNLAKEEPKGDFNPTGAFWDDDKKVVLFRIRGEVFDADTGQPLDGFHLQAELVNSKDFAQIPGQGIAKEFSALKEGTFVVEGMGLGTWRVTAKREGYAPVMQMVDISKVDATPYLVIPLSGGATLSGRVVDWRGTPVSDAMVGLTECVEGADASKKNGCNTVKSDSAGNFLLDKLPDEGTYSLYAKHKRYGYAISKNLQSSLEEGVGTHITIALSGRVRIFGTVTKGQENRPVVGATLAGGDERATTDKSGSYSMIVALEEYPESHIVGYPGAETDNAIHSYPLDRAARALRWVDTDTHAAELQIDFQIEMSEASLSGHIRDEKGNPRSQVMVRLHNTNGWMKERGHQTFPTKAVTDEKGRYHIDHVPSEAGYLVVYRVSEEEEWQPLGYVNVPDESPVIADFEMGAALIRGRFVHADSGAPTTISQADCSRFGAERKDGPGVFFMPQCYPDGRFEFRNLKEGRYTLHSKVKRHGDSVVFVEETIQLKPGEHRNDLDFKVEGDAAVVWKFRILNKAGTFVGGPYIRYTVENTTNTANLAVDNSGIATIQIAESISDVFIEAPGYSPGIVKLSSQDASKVLEIRLEKATNE